MTKEEILKNAIVGVVCDELDYEHGNFQFYKEEVLQAMEDYAESENERLKAEREWISVETPPELDTTVWIFCDGFVTIAYYWMYCDEPAYHSGDERFYPTHWMILVKPQPPKQ